VKVSGLAATVEITGAEPANDVLDINTLLGTDTVKNKLAPNTIGLFVNAAPA
jgi:hypothetical protein